MALRGRSSTIAALVQASTPLLKFKNDKAFLHGEGLARISGIDGPIYPVILMGDGRAGKSYLASRLLGLEEAFFSSDSAEPVTEGIDCVVFPMSKLLASTPGFEEEAKQAEAERMSMLVLDCEGGNNAMAAIRTLVNVFGVIIGTEVIFVAGGSFSEAALQNLGASLAARSLIRLEGSSRLPEQRLIFVVNKNTLKYDENTLDKALLAEQNDPGRRENRQLILDSFEDRSFFSVPLIGMPKFEESVAALRSAVMRDRRPLMLGGAKVQADQLKSLLELIVNEMQSMKEVSFPSMSRCVILDGFLRPLAKKLLAAAAHDLPELADYDPDLDTKDPRAKTLAVFDREVEHVTDRILLCEARDELSAGLEAEWAKAKQVNEVFGEQTEEVSTESQEIATSTTRIPLGGRGLLSRVTLMQQTIRLETRTKSVKKNGFTEYTEWADTGTPTQKVVESAFHNFSTTVPSLIGSLLKRSPSLFKTVLTFGAGVFQERTCVVKEGHILWWDNEKSIREEQEVAGAINFLVNRAIVEEDPENPSVFVVRPATADGWAESASFSGGNRREMVFNVSGSQYTREQWVSCLRRNIEFANLASQQLGQERLLQEVGSQIPVLAQALYNVRR